MAYPAPKITEPCGQCQEQASQACARCKGTYYCSSECQKKHWQIHKTKYKPVSAKSDQKSNLASEIITQSSHVFFSPMNAGGHPLYNAAIVVLNRLGVQATILPGVDMYMPRDQMLVTADGKEIYKNTITRSVRQSFASKILSDLRSSTLTMIDEKAHQKKPEDSYGRVFYSQGSCVYRRSVENQHVMPEESIKPHLAGRKENKTTISGGNLMVVNRPGMPPLLLLGEDSLLNDYLLTEQKLSYKVYVQQRTTELKRQFQTEILVLPQCMYHLDIFMAAPKSGTVILNTFKPLFENKGLWGSILAEILKNEFVRRQFHEHGDAGLLKDHRSYFDYLEKGFDFIEQKLRENGIKVIRAFGALAYPSKVKGVYDSIDRHFLTSGKNLFKADTYCAFNFFNGLAVNKEDKHHFISLATLPALQKFQGNFSKTLNIHNITTHFVSDGTLNLELLNASQAGYRCLSVVIPNAVHSC